MVFDEHVMMCRVFYQNLNKLLYKLFAVVVVVIIVVDVVVIVVVVTWSGASSGWWSRSRFGNHTQSGCLRDRWGVNDSRLEQDALVWIQDTIDTALSEL